VWRRREEREKRELYWLRGEAIYKGRKCLVISF
jgi:hypothetical protein